MLGDLVASFFHNKHFSFFELKHVNVTLCEFLYCVVDCRFTSFVAFKGYKNMISFFPDINTTSFILSTAAAFRKFYEHALKSKKKKDFIFFYIYQTKCIDDDSK